MLDLFGRILLKNFLMLFFFNRDIGFFCFNLKKKISILIIIEFLMLYEYVFIIFNGKKYSKI